MSFTAVTPVDITPGTDDSWISTDLSAYIPANATGVVCLLVNNRNDGEKINIRHGDSTDNFLPDLRNLSQQWAMCGVNSFSEIDVYIESTSAEVYLIGYFDDSSYFQTNGTDITPGTTGSYQDVDISATTGTDTALAAHIFFITNDATTTQWARLNGITGDQDLKGDSKEGLWMVVPCDANEVFEVYIESGPNCYLLGWTVDKFVANDPAVDVSLGSTGSYADLTAIADSDAVAGVYAVKSSAQYNFALRTNGTSIDEYHDAWNNASAIVACDENQLVEGKIENTGVDFYEVGYFTSDSQFAPTDEMRYGFAGVLNRGFGMAGFA